MIKRTLAILSALAIAGASLAQQGFALRKTDIRAAYLHLRNDHAPIANPVNAGAPMANVAPFVWYNLDSNTQIKPAGWNIYNPLASGTLTSDESAFFQTIFANTPVVPVGATGPENTKRNAAYWWLNVANLTDDDMDMLDVAMLQVATPALRVHPSDRERLRRFVDKGGVLWVDLSYGSFDQANGLPLPFRAVFPGSPNANPQWDLQTQLFRYPYTLNSNEIQSIATGPNYGLLPTNKAGLDLVDLSTEGAGSIAPLLHNLVGPLGDYGQFKAVAAAAGSATAIYARVGDGFLVVTSRGVSEMANRIGSNLNRGFYAADPSLQIGRTTSSSLEPSSALKFMVNLISLAAESNQLGGGSRKVSSSFIDTGAPLLQTFSAELSENYDYRPNDYAPGGLTQPSRAPIIYKGFAITVSDNRIYVFDADPKRDADGYGTTDDGVADLSLGEDRDLVWASQTFSGPISSPVCAEIPNAGTPGMRDIVMVTTHDGNLAIFGLYDNARRLKALTNVGPDAVLNPGLGGGAATLNAGEFPVAPTVFEQIAYVADNVNVSGNPGGRVWLADLRQLSVVQSPSSNNFMFGGTTVPIQRITGSPTVGYVPILDNSGGLDKVIYAPLAAQSTPFANAGFISLWAGVKGERPASVTESGGVVQIFTRAARKGGAPIYLGTGLGDSLGFRLTIVRNDGTVFSAAEMAALFSGAVTQSNGTVSLTLNPLVTWPPVNVNPDNGIRVDYTLDWGAAFPATTSVIERGRLQFPAPNGQPRNVVGGLALSPSGTIYATVSTQFVKPDRLEPGVPDPNINNYNGSLFALREEGIGNFRCAWKWDLYPQHSFSTSAGSVTWQSALPDNDPITNLVIPGIGSLNGILGGGMRLATLQGAPMIRNGEVYVTISGAKRSVGGFNVPAGGVLCFADDVSTREIRVNRRLGTSAVVVQPDIARSTNPTQPNQFSTLTPERLQIEKEPGEVGGVIRIDNMMLATRGQINDALSVSQPVIIREQGQPDFVYDPGQSGDRWNPLKWYTIFHGTQLTNTAFGTGNTLFVSGRSMVPGLFNGEFSPPLTIPLSGMVFALRTDFDATQAKRPSNTGAFTTNPADFEPQEVIADQGRPYLRQVISMDYVRATNSFTSGQLSLNTIRPSQIYAWPQTPRSNSGVVTFDDYIVRLNQCVLRPEPKNGAGVGIGTSLGVVAGDGLLLAWTPTQTGAAPRIHGFRRANTWVADEGRIVQLDPSGNPIFDSTRFFSSGATGGNTNANSLRQLVRPTRVYPIANSADALVVDSDKNHIYRMSPNGNLSRSLFEFSADTTFVPSGYKAGESLTFSNPRDAWTWVSQETPAGSGGNNRFTNPQPLETWVHYLVADQGNGRLIEVVDRYAVDATTGRVTGNISEGTLLWHSPSEVSGKGWNYNSFTRLQVGNRMVIVAGVGNKAPSQEDAGGGVVGTGDVAVGRDSQTGNGSIVIFDSLLPGGYRVLNKFSVPAISGAVQWDWAGSAWAANSQLALPSEKFFSGLQSVTATLFKQSPAAPASYAIMVADATGVYELQADPANPVALSTRWMLPNWAYGALRRSSAGIPQTDNPRGFLPTYARRLDDDNVIVVNGFNGLTRANLAFGGEVIQIDGSFATSPIGDGFSLTALNLGFKTKSVRLRYGAVEGTRGLSLPVFADRR